MNNTNPFRLPWSTHQYNQSDAFVVDSDGEPIVAMQGVIAEMIATGVNILHTGLIIYHNDNGTGVYIMPENTSPVEFARTLALEHDDPMDSLLVNVVHLYSYINGCGKVVLCADYIYLEPVDS